MRIYNFSAGPAMLPTAVMEKAQAEMCDYQNTGMSIIEMSHRGGVFTEVINRAEKNLRELMGISDDYLVLFLQGGASLQFGMVPMNLMGENGFAQYVDTGAWAQKAMSEAKLFGRVEVVASSASENFQTIPTLESFINQVDEKAAYLHITTNETIQGTQWKVYPKVKIPLVADMSSDILSKPFNVNDFGLIYAGAQKNIGPSGVTLVIIRKDLLERAPKNITTLLKYKTQLKEPSLYNTPCTFGIYMIALVTDWIKSIGGIEAMAKINAKKASKLYAAIDNSKGFYRCPNQVAFRSEMNVVFRLPNEEMESAFAKQAEKVGLSGLKGHRSVGGMRASIYNAMPEEGVDALITFMEKFQSENNK